MRLIDPNDIGGATLGEAALRAFVSTPRAVRLISQTTSADGQALLNGAPLRVVADYVAFMSSAQINPELSDPDFPTILNLFSNRDPAIRPMQLTEWNLGYLDGRYHVTQSARDARDASEQESEIERPRMRLRP